MLNKGKKKDMSVSFVAWLLSLFHLKILIATNFVFDISTQGGASLTLGYNNMSPTGSLEINKSHSDIKILFSLRPVGPLGNSQFRWLSERSAWFGNEKEILWQSVSSIEKLSSMPQNSLHKNRIICS